MSKFSQCSPHNAPSCTLTLIQVRQLGAGEPKRDRARFPRFPVDEAVRVERFDHLMDDRRCHPEKPLKVRLCRRSTMNLAVVVDERQVLSLLGGERFHLARSGNRDPCHDENLNSALKIIRDDGPVRATKNLERRSDGRLEDEVRRAWR